MKFQAAALLAAMLALSLVGCGDTGVSPPETTVTTAEETAPETTVINHVKVPVEDYTGLWYDGKNAANNVIIAGYPQKGIHFCARFDNSLSISGIGVYTDGKYIFGIVKVSERGQITLPKHARKVFGIEAGDRLLVLGDEKKGMALAKIKNPFDKLMK